MADMSLTGCPEQLGKFIKMRLDSQFFSEEYKNVLIDMIIEAAANQDWAAVQKYMWPQVDNG